MSKFIFVRHGQSEGNAEGYIASAKTKLTELGIKQARETAEKLKEFKIDIIACSPMIRAQQTAETIAAELGINVASIKVIEELRERGLGLLEDNPKDHENDWYPTFDNEFGAESRRELIDRMDRAVTKIKELVKDKKTVLVVGHAISGYYLIEVASGRRNIEEFEPPTEILNAGIVEVSIGKNWGEL